MWKDPIIEELQQLRQEYAKQFNYDWQAIFEELKAQERKNTTNPIASLPMHKWTWPAATDKSSRVKDRQRVFATPPLLTRKRRTTHPRCPRPKFFNRDV